MGLEPGTTKADVRRCLRSVEPRGQRHSVPVPRVQAAGRDRMADRSRHPARPGLARHLRAAGQQRRVRACSSPKSEGRIIDWSLLTKDVPAGSSPRSRLHHRHARLGRECESRVRALESRLPTPVAHGRSDTAVSDPQTDADGYRELAWVCYGTGALLGERADRCCPGGSRPSSDAAALRPDPHPGPRQIRLCSVATPSMIRFWTDDGGRVVRHERRRAGRRAHREHERDGSARHPQAFLARAIRTPSRRAAARRR